MLTAFSGPCIYCHGAYGWPVINYICVRIIHAFFSFNHLPDGFVQIVDHFLIRPKLMIVQHLFRPTSLFPREPFAFKWICVQFHGLKLKAHRRDFAHTVRAHATSEHAKNTIGESIILIFKWDSIALKTQHIPEHDAIPIQNCCPFFLPSVSIALMRMVASVVSWPIWDCFIMVEHQNETA